MIVSCCFRVRKARRTQSANDERAEGTDSEEVRGWGSESAANEVVRRVESEG